MSSAFRMLPCESVIVMPAAFRPGTAPDTSLVMPFTWPESRVMPGFIWITTDAVVGSCWSVNSCSCGMAILTVAEETGSRRPMVRDSSPSVARTRFTRLVKSVAPRLLLSKISLPTTPPPSSTLEPARSRRALSRSPAGTWMVVPPSASL